MQDAHDFDRRHRISKEEHIRLSWETTNPFQHFVSGGADFTVRLSEQLTFVAKMRDDLCGEDGAGGVLDVAGDFPEVVLGAGSEDKASQGRPSASLNLANIVSNTCSPSSPSPRSSSMTPCSTAFRRTRSLASRSRTWSSSIRKIGRASCRERVRMPMGVFSC